MNQSEADNSTNADACVNWAVHVEEYVASHDTGLRQVIQNRLRAYSPDDWEDVRSETIASLLKRPQLKPLYLEYMVTVANRRCFDFIRGKNRARTTSLDEDISEVATIDDTELELIDAIQALREFVQARSHHEHKDLLGAWPFFCLTKLSGCDPSDVKLIMSLDDIENASLYRLVVEDRIYYDNDLTPQGLRLFRRYNTGKKYLTALIPRPVRLLAEFVALYGELTSASELANSLGIDPTTLRSRIGLITHSISELGKKHASLEV